MTASVAKIYSKELRLEVIDTSIRTRYRLDKATIKDYEEAMRSGAVFPPLVVFSEKNSQRYVLADGHHRLEAAKRLKKNTFLCTVKRGDKHIALRFALGANADHGLRRSNADKRKCVLLAMNCPDFDGWSMRMIADLCHVSRPLVSDVKQSIIEKAQETEEEGGSSATKTRDRVRKTKVPPTQDESDRTELSGALAVIKSFPYNGAEGYQRMNLSDDINAVNFCIDWLTEVLVEHNSAQYQPADAHRSSRHVTTEQPSV